jgi:hypothetical protein
MSPSPSNERVRRMRRPLACAPASDVTLKGRIGRDQRDAGHCPHARHSPDQSQLTGPVRLG